VNDTLSEYAYVDAALASGRVANQIKLHGPDGFAGMRRAGRLVADCLDMIAGEVREGVTTSRLDDLIRQFTFDNGGIPATLGYRGYRHSSCISINHVICHGIPGERTLRAGDILNIDVTVIVDGWHGDHSRMYAVPPVKRRVERLLEVTQESLARAIAEVRPGVRLGMIGHVIQTFVEANRMSVVRDFCGHGLGRIFHEPPNVTHFGEPWEGPELKPGMFFTIEPMVNLGRPDAKILSDGWTAVTKDREPSAQVEHSVGVTEDGCEVFTLSSVGLHAPWKEAIPG
jgi:methionyl aminopeptidase